MPCEYSEAADMPKHFDGFFCAQKMITVRREGVAQRVFGYGYAAIMLNAPVHLIRCGDLDLQPFYNFFKKNVDRWVPSYQSMRHERKGVCNEN